MKTMLVRLVDLGQTVDLVEDVGCGEIALKSLLARLTEQAVHLAAHFARDAKRGVAAFLWDEDRLDELRAFFAGWCVRGKDI